MYIIMYKTESMKQSELSAVFTDRFTLKEAQKIAANFEHHSFIKG